MAKKTSKGGKKNGKGNKKSGSKKLRKDGVCTALKKQKRQRLIPADKSDSHIVKRKTKRPASVSDHFRNFDERMAAKSARRTGPSSKASVVSSTFVMAPPTFQL
ncbi:hypothetical protein PsorP6_013110 [Peronosclerospora sorghi]|uniref:Uncharacterized protein n=1 Tax=Peronosclerospora sorghi TaxID=230839 RepID=A0ACC0WGI3_9STRA|nr:hypothetical protein PsorP6_013110 [Peronosclerospora sorghi]